ncbi:MAG: APC family permease [Acidobacteriaceae bacterium]
MHLRPTGHQPSQPGASHRQPDRQLDRQIGLRSAVTLNMLEMVGVGPFITLPLIVAAMGGPQAMLGWILGALLAVCDGLVWAELGAALPYAGGSYAFLREIYGPRGAGRMISFLYVWQFTLTAPLSIASGAIGLAEYAVYLVPRLNHSLLSSSFPPFLLQHSRGTVLLAIAVCCLAMLLLYRQTRVVERIAWFLSAGLLLTIAAVLFACFTHFHPALAFGFPPGAFHLSGSFFQGLGAATLMATYCYWGYYNICFLGAEVRDPGRTIPRAVLYSILGVAALYLLMNIGILGAVPWQDLLGRYSHSRSSGDNPVAAVALVIGHIMGPVYGRIVVGLVMWTAFASLFSLLLGASRVPYAAASEGNYFRSLQQLHPTRGFPARSLLLLGGIACICCFFDLKTVIQALVALRIVLQFLLQQVGVIVLRRRAPDLPRPFRMWLYPIPALVACAGFLFMLFSRHGAGRELIAALIVSVSGSVVYLLRANKRREWPFLPNSPAL